MNTKTMLETHNPQTREAAYRVGVKEGFAAAVRALDRIKLDDNNGGNTRCIHASDWALFLDRNFDDILKDSLE